MDAAETKKTMRARLREQLQAIPAEELHARSGSACRRLCETDRFADAEALMIFLPLTHEVDARPIAVRAWQAGKTVTVPLVSYEQRRMMPLAIRSLAEPMEADRYGVRTPIDGEPIPPEMIDLVVVPGLAFDVEGRRIGRGGGFYDRFLAQPAFGGRSCGLALEEQIVERVPTAEHDVMLGMLVTDRRVLQFGDGRERG